MRTKNARPLSLAIAALLVAQLLLPFHLASAGPPINLTGTPNLAVHGTDYTPPEQKSSLTITTATGGAISPVATSPGIIYENIPAGAKISLDYAFHLEDIIGTDLYDYTGDEFFTAALPAGLNFATASGIITANHDGLYNYELATWSISGSALTVELTNDPEDTTGHGGAAAAAHTGKWGKIHIEGTFQALNPGGDTETQIKFGEQTITINRQPLPMESTLAKKGVYDASDNTIAWTVTVTPPAGAPHMLYNGYSLIDEYSAGQTYVPGSFTVGGASVSDSALELTAGAVAYTFPASPPDITGPAIISYKTSPDDFSAEDGSSATAEYSQFKNEVNLKRGEDFAADPAEDTVRLDWISKSGAMAGTDTDPTIAKWTVNVTVPGTTGASISGAAITDTIRTELELLSDPAYPVQIKFGTAGAIDVASGGGIGQYDYSGTTLTYKFPAGSQPTAGTTATLTYYTRVKASYRDIYLNNNEAIPFTNGAELTWDKAVATSIAPSDTATIGSGVGAGGLLSKSAAGGTPPYDHSASEAGVIHWTVKVNRNQINIADAKITDTVPTGQALLIDAEHPFKVTKIGSPDEAVFTTVVKTTTAAFTSTDSFVNNFAYEFPDEDALDGLDDTIKSTYTVEYYTRIVDADSGAYGDAWGLDILYSNGTIGFGNSVTLTRTTGGAVTAGGAKDYSSQMLHKSVARAYDYVDRTVQWELAVNRNRLPLTNAVVTDTVPTGMALLIDAGHLFKVMENGVVKEELSSTSASVNLTSADGFKKQFAYALSPSTSTSALYTITFWTKMNEDTLKIQWNGDKDFTNNTSLGAIEITTPVTHSAVARIKNPVISKSYTYTPNSDYIDWSVVINPGQVTLTGGAVTDVLNPGLRLDPDSVRLYTVPVNPVTGAASPASSGTAVSAAAVTLPTAGNGNTLTVNLPSPTSFAYRLEFTTFILVDDLDLSNSAVLSGSAGGPSGSAASSQIVINDLYSSGGSGSNKLTVVKTGAGGLPLAGATFRLLNVNRQPITSGGHLIERETTAAGVAVFDNLPSWIFYVEETVPAPGYLLPADPTFGGNRLTGTETIPVSNSLARGDVSFDKTGAGGVPLTGGAFTLTGKDYADQDVTITASAVNGKVTFTNVPLGKTGWPYTITELTPPDGHYATTAALTATIAYNASKSGVTVSVSSGVLANTPLPGTVSFDKTGAGGALLTGGAFTLTGTDYALNPVTLTASAVNGTVAFSNVPIGSYTITETDPVPGHLLPADADILTATVAYNAGRTGVVTTLHETSAGAIVSAFANAPALGDLSFAKLSTGGSPLSGGTFTLTGKDYAGQDVTMTASASGGTVTFTGVPLNQAGQVYTIRETVPPSGYRQSDPGAVITATVAYNATKTAVETSVSPAALYNTPVPGTVFGSIVITKTDEQGSKLAGAEFTLYRQSNGSVVSTAVSDSNGTARFSQVPAGQYIIRETGAPKGYAFSSDSIEVTVSGTASRSFTVVNKAEEVPPVNVDKPDSASVQIKKVDEDSNPLAGAEFTLYNASGAAIGKAVSGKDGLVRFEGLAPGRYSVMETAAPEGYALFSEPLNFEVKAEQALAYTLRNRLLTEEDSDILGYTADGTQTPTSTLPKTGGISGISALGIAGLLLLIAGLLMAKPRKHKGISGS